MANDSLNATDLLLSTLGARHRDRSSALRQPVAGGEPGVRR